MLCKEARTIEHERGSLLLLTQASQRCQASLPPFIMCRQAKSARQAKATGGCILSCHGQWRAYNKLTASDSGQTELPILIASLLVARTARSETLFRLQVHVILFGVDSGDAEGIYSLRALTDDDAVPTDTIVAFECRQDAERYATLLEATMSHKPDVVPISPGTAGSAGSPCSQGEVRLA